MTSSLLVTTALEETWRKDVNILFWVNGVKAHRSQFGVNLILKQFHTIKTTEINLTKIIYILRNCIKHL